MTDRGRAADDRAVLDPIVAQRVSTLVLEARRAVDGLLSGMHKSPHRGASVVFVEHREYRPGDDLRLLDWRAYARTDRHMIKRFEQETQLRATLVLDRSSSMAYPRALGQRTKAEHAATLLAALGYVLVRQGDATGAASFDDTLGAMLPARSRPTQMDALAAALAEPPREGAETDLAAALGALSERAGRRGFIAIASDLLDFREGALTPLGPLVAHGHDVVVFHVMHPDELTLPLDGPTRFEGTEGEAPLEADPVALRDAYRREVGAFVDSCRARCAAVGARYVLARTDEPPEHTLAKLLTSRGAQGMGLEAPWALIGALLAAAPIVAHLVRRRDLPRHALPTIALLRRAQVTSQRRTRVIDLLLLVVRVALIATTAVALAAPYRRVRLPYGDGVRATVAIILDDSLSMGQRAARSGTPYAAAIARALEVLQALPPGSEAAIVLGGARPRVLVARTAELAVAMRRLSELGDTPPTRGTALDDALPLALRELAGSRTEARRVLVLTDGAAHAHADTLEVPSDVALAVERFGARRGAAAPANVSIASATAVPDPSSAGRVSVLVELRASGAAPAGVLALRLERADLTVARAEVTFSGGVARHALQAPLAGADDDPTARVIVETGDLLAADDTRGVLLRAPSSLRVLVVGDRRATQPIARALGLVPEREGAVDARLVDSDTLATLDLSAYDAVVLAGITAPSDVTSRTLRTFVERGGGLVVAAGDGVDARELDAALGAVLPARPRGVAPSPATLGLRSGDADGALSDSTGLAGTAIHKRLLVEAPRRGARVPLAFTDGAPALIVGRAGAGRVALFTTSLDESWCDLPLRPGFLPLVARLVRDVAPAARTPDRPFLPGETVQLPLPPGASRLVVTRPDGEHESFEGATRATVHRTTLPGAYRVEVADRGGALRDAPRLAFVVAAPPSESELSAGSEPPATRTRSEPGATATQVKRPLAPWLFLLVGVLAVIEGALRFRWRRATPKT